MATIFRVVYVFLRDATKAPRLKILLVTHQELTHDPSEGLDPQFEKRCSIVYNIVAAEAARLDSRDYTTAEKTSENRRTTSQPAGSDWL